jgi:nitrate/TMAO reductase-like tetraheme cytochrome c subunit
VHAGQFAENGGVNCTRCHNDLAWKIEDFDHSKTRFPLDGKHSGVSCYKCHKTISGSGKTYIQYKFNDIRCEACHL